jgi:CubicO group peptidase (beta-lactamase class C family)
MGQLAAISLRLLCTSPHLHISSIHQLSVPIPPTTAKMPVSAQAHETIKSSLDSVTSDPSSGIQGLVFISVDKHGDILASHASGKRAPSSPDPMTLDTVFWIASCTKMLTGLACMQLVEQGKLSLDDPQQLYKICPDLEKIKVLEDGKLVDRKGDITLRMLLAHTAGFGYEFFDPRLLHYGRQGGMGVKGPGYDVFSGDARDITRQPLVNQPGTMWEYGVRRNPLGMLKFLYSRLSPSDI